MKIKTLFANLITMFKKIFERFPITIAVISFLTLFFAIFMDTRLLSPKIFSNIMAFSLYFIFGSLLTESIYKDNSPKRTPLYIIFAIVALILILFQNIVHSQFTLLRLIICYISTLAIMSVYFLFKHSETTFENYILKIFSNIIKSSFTYGILALGIAIIYSIFVYLIFDIKFSLLGKLEIILFGFYFVTRTIYSLVDTEGETNNFFKGLIKYVLSSLLFASFVIIYMYIFKILVFRDMPKNQVFRILAALFIIGMPIWTMAQNYIDNNLWSKITLKLPIAFIPFIFLQIYSIGIRIIDNGITPFRYICIMLIIFEIIYVILYLIQKQHMENLLLVFNALIIVSLIVPILNMFSVSNMSQYNRLKVYFKKSTYTDEEKASICSAYDFLKNSLNGKKYLKELTDADLEKISTFRKFPQSYIDYNYASASNKLGKLNVYNYSSLYFINVSQSRRNSTNISEIIVQPKDSNIKINLTNEIKNYISIDNKSTSNSFQEYFKDNSEITISPNMKLVLSYINVRYIPSTLEIYSYSIEGYLLVND